MPSRALLMQTIRLAGRQQGPSPGLLNAVLAGRQAGSLGSNPSGAEPKAGLSALAWGHLSSTLGGRRFSSNLGSYPLGASSTSFICDVLKSLQHSGSLPGWSWRKPWIAIGLLQILCPNNPPGKGWPPLHGLLLEYCRDE